MYIYIYKSYNINTIITIIIIEGLSLLQLRPRQTNSSTKERGSRVFSMKGFNFGVNKI